LAVCDFGGLTMKRMNNKEDFFAKVFNIQDKKFPKISLFFVIAIVFEFLVALPIYSFLSKRIGEVLLIAVLLVFLTISVYGILKIIRYFLNN
jgi:steroid 5-alpha reductase family enzyme